jgi:hypothetical protein
MRFRIALAACAALCTGCPALLPFSALLGDMRGGGAGDALIATHVELGQANFCVVRSNVIGESRGLTLLLFLTVDPTSYVEAFEDLELHADLQAQRSQAFANLAYESTVRNFLVFALTKVAVRADVVEFLEPGANCDSHPGHTTAPG